MMTNCANSSKVEHFPLEKAGAGVARFSSWTRSSRTQRSQFTAHLIGWAGFGRAGFDRIRHSRSQEKAALYQSFASSKRPGRARRTSLPWSLRITTRVSTWLDGWVGQNYSKDNMRCPREFMYFFGMRYYFPKNDADFKQHSIVNGGACVARRLVLDPREPPLVKKDGIVDLEYAPLLVVVEPEKKPGHGAKAISLDLPAEEDGTGRSAYCPKATISR